MFHPDIPRVAAMARLLEISHVLWSIHCALRENGIEVDGFSMRMDDQGLPDGVAPLSLGQAVADLGEIFAFLGGTTFEEMKRLVTERNNGMLEEMLQRENPGGMFN